MSLPYDRQTCAWQAIGAVNNIADIESQFIETGSRMQRTAFTLSQGLNICQYRLTNQSMKMPAVLNSMNIKVRLKQPGDQVAQHSLDMRDALINPILPDYTSTKGATR
jgi:hypothetical protein